MSRILNVSPSGYYARMKRNVQQNREANTLIFEKVKEIHKKNKFTFGRPRMCKALQMDFPGIGERRVRRIMKTLKITGRKPTKYKVRTTDSNHKMPISKNLLNQQFHAEKSDQIWTSDVTCFKTMYSWIYLCVILDVFSRRVIGWHLSRSNDAELVNAAFQKAIQLRTPRSNVIFHSDRGSNYCSLFFRKTLKENNFIQSMSRKGNCWDNAVTESFFSSLKRELEVNRFKDIEEAKIILFEHIEIFYNRQRLHSTLGYKSPIEFEKLKNFGVH